MDLKSKEVNGCQNEHMGAAAESVKNENHVNGVENDSNCLLPPCKGGMSRTLDNKQRKVHWNDRNGDKLVEVLEFQPSDVSDSDNEDADICICSVM